MNRLMPYLIAVVATYAAIQSWRRAHSGAPPAGFPQVMGAPGESCPSCATNPAACCGH